MGLRRGNGISLLFFERWNMTAKPFSEHLFLAFLFVRFLEHMKYVP